MSTPVTIQLNVPALHQHLNVVGACIEALLSRCDDITDPDSSRYNMQLAVHEICTNIVDHAYGGSGGRIDLTLTYADGVFSAALRDEGRSFDPDLVPAPDLDNPSEHGLGLFLVYQLMDQVEYLPGHPGNVWRLSKRLKE